MIEAVNGYVLVKPVKKEEKEKGIILPSSTSTPGYEVAEVVSSKCKEFAVGDKVFTHFHTGNEIKWEDEKYYFIHEQYIHGKLK